MPSYRKFYKQESREESRAMCAVGIYQSFSLAIDTAHLSREFDSWETKRDRKKVEYQKPVKVHAPDVLKILVKKFMDIKGGRTLIKLTDTDSLLDEFVPWGFDQGERYSNLDKSVGGRQWFRAVAHMAIQWCILENKYVEWLACEDLDNSDEDYWYDDRHRIRYEHYYLDRAGMSANARIAYKAQEDKDLARELIQMHHQVRMEQLNKSLRAEAFRIEENWQQEDRKEENRRKHAANDDDSAASGVAI